MENQEEKQMECSMDLLVRVYGWEFRVGALHFQGSENGMLRNGCRYHGS